MAFFALAYLFSWIVAVPLALSAQGLLPIKLPLELHYLTAYGPGLAAAVLSLARMGWRQFWSAVGRSATWRVGYFWFAAAVLSPLILFAAGAIIQVVAGDPSPNIGALGHVNFLGDIGLLALPFWIVTSGLGEEPGWRGYALPRLQQRYTAMTATLILWLFWLGWHLPAFFYLPNYMAMGPALFPGSQSVSCRARSSSPGSTTARAAACC